MIAHLERGRVFQQSVAAKKMQVLQNQPKTKTLCVIVFQIAFQNDFCSSYTPFREALSERGCAIKYAFKISQIEAINGGCEARSLDYLKNL